MVQRLCVVWVVGGVLGVAWPARAQDPAPAAKTAQPEQRISLDLKGVDILDVLKLLSQKSGLNFIAGRNVSGRVTIFVNDVDVWEAFELIIGANDLAYEQQGNIITVMMARDYELLYGEKFQERRKNLVVTLKHAKAAQVSTVLNQVKSSVGRVVADEGTNTLIISEVPTQLVEMQSLLKELDRPVEQRVYSLNYADAEKLKEKIQELLSPVGTFTFDARTNKAVVADLPEALERADRVIRAFDTPEGQVLIEAKIINVTLNDNTSLGIDWQRLLPGVDVSTRSNLLTRGSTPVISGDVFTGSTVQGTAVRVIGSAVGSEARLVIEALNKIGKTETLANPRIMVSNNQEAKILVGTKEAFITSTVQVPDSGNTITSPEVKTEDVGTKLFVTPNIKYDGHIQLKIHPEVSSVARTITSVANTIVPIVQTTEAETNVLVKSGVTLIIGGLIDSKDEHTTNQIPWIGNLPVIGIPFRGQSVERRKTELVVFLTPQIVMPDGLPSSPSVVGEAVQSPVATSTTTPEVVLKEPVSTHYRQTVRQSLQEHLTHEFRAESLQQGSVVVSFVLSHDGSLVRVEDVASPQGAAFVLAAREALAQVHFPPFPDGSPADEVRFRLAVEYVP